jgi:hypothetical protein
MAEQVSSADEWETGGAQVIFGFLHISAGSAHEPAALRNPIPDLKKDERKNPIGARKKKVFDFYTTPTHLFPNNSLDRSSQEKNFPNTVDLRLKNKAEMELKIGSSVTTSHVFWPNERRKPAFSLPIRLPNPGFLRSKPKGPMPGGGGSLVDARENAMTEKCARNFSLKGSPAQFMLTKKSALGKRRQFRPGGAEIST